MIIISFIYVFVFAMIGEYLRTKYFNLGRIFKRTQTTVSDVKKEAKVTDDQQDNSEPTNQLVQEAKSEKV